MIYKDDTTGKLHWRLTGAEVRNPAILVDKEHNVLHKHGEHSDLVYVLDAWSQADFTGVICRGLSIHTFDLAVLEDPKLLENFNSFLHCTGKTFAPLFKQLGVAELGGSFQD